MGGERLDVRGIELTRQSPKGHGANAAHEGRSLGGAHAGVEDLHSGGAAVVVHEHDEGILGDTQCFDFSHQLADVLIDIVDHAEEVLGVLAEPFAFIQRRIFRAGMIRSVGRIGRDVRVERPLGGSLPFDPLGRLFEEFVSAIARRLHELAVMKQRGCVVGVTRDVATAAGIALADTTGAMDVDLVKATLVRLILSLVAQVPLAEDARAVARLL